MGNTTGRLPRFRRSAEEIRTMKLTSRDKDVIRQVAQFHFLRSTQIVRLVNGATAQLLRRLQALYHHGYLDRPRSQIDFFQQGGSRPMVYGLGSRGAALMRREFDVPFSKMVWSRSDGSVGRIFLEHTLMVAEILISVAERCKSTDNVKFIAAEELQPSKQKEGQFRWQATINGKRLGLIPDAAFALDFMDKPMSRRRVICLLEADRGTMPVTRRSPHQSCISRKLSLYAHLWKSGAFERRFETKRIAVHTVTTTQERATNIALAASKSLGAGLFAAHVMEGVAIDASKIISHSS